MVKNILYMTLINFLFQDKTYTSCFLVREFSMYRTQVLLPPTWKHTCNQAWPCSSVHLIFSQLMPVTWCSGLPLSSFSVFKRALQRVLLPKFSYPNWSEPYHKQEWIQWQVWMINIQTTSICFSFSRCTGSQKTLTILWNPQVHYHVHKIQQLAPIMSQMNSMNTLSSFTFNFWSSKSHIDFHCLGSSK
jgi:hypothetical protein